ncbi:peroxiredoxin [Sulfuracidifex metallicus]|uniref:thioredoxin-dependent peroxiredoxin n=1 Tax=Sulfuracidifex metallicus DSM 6482 = JCM 9184 TaxID=523847 RepID=A0A6A9QML3_SULME|nr:peroxiredoxin [Sulfuracidifex metallicus]MUN28958.1 redoxin domain-containing protein [Sulfuracidifex metallicus DSM 6482 = JCM 9184]WOE50537.1 peroxiredoxin [Sulfuracidifex metallicus DSM 6482 = JCM 9184]
MKVNVGDQAPDFKAITDEGKEISLSQFRGKYIILYFYPKDNTPGCTREAISFRDRHDELEKEGAVVIGISSDSASSHKGFKEKYSLPFILVSDEGGKIREMYGAKSFLGPSRTTFVISPEGKVIHVYNSQINPARHPEEALRAIRQDKERSGVTKV